jgi:DNA ligase (NAD+)
MSWTVEQLEDAITTLDTAFEEGQDCVFEGKLYTDGEYDALRKQLGKLSPNSTALQAVTASTVSTGFTKIKHHPPMCSLNKINGTQAEKESELADWFEECREELGDKVRYTKAFKLDGVALRLYYTKGRFVKAGLRPNDGITADDVTENCKHIAGIPMFLKEKVTCSISGEVVCFLDDFKKINEDLEAAGEKLRANPRNHAAGAIRQLDPTKTKAGKLNFIAYSVENFDGTIPYKDETERAKWANQNLSTKSHGAVRFVRVSPLKNASELQEMEDLVSKLEYEVDGVVLSVANLDDQEQCGKHGNSVTANPKGKIAWKFKEKSADVIVKGWIEQVGRTGRIVPVLQFEAVNLAGTQVRQATGHNIGFMERKQITKGTVVRIIKSGKIIPKVIGVVKKKGDPVFLTHCPCCQSKLEIVEGGTVDGVANRDLYCQNDDCAAKNVGNLRHYLDTFGVKGLGESTIQSLIEGGLISSPADFYTLRVKDIVIKSTLSERQATLAVAGIHMVSNPSSTKDNEKLLAKIEKARKNKKKIQAARFFACLGIAGAGKGTGKALVEHFKDWNRILDATTEELVAVPDVGETTAKVINAYLDGDGYKIIDDLLKHVELELPKTGPLSGSSFCFSGGFEGGKRKWEIKVEELGGTIKSSVGKSTTYLVEGENAGSKVAKAQGYGVTILSIDDLEKKL